MLTIGLVLCASGLATLAVFLFEAARIRRIAEWTPGDEMEYRIAVSEYRGEN